MNKLLDSPLENKNESIYMTKGVEEDDVADEIADEHDKNKFNRNINFVIN
jgi:hypothetical protein